MSRSPLTLICFGSGPQCHQLQNAIEQTYEQVQLRDGARWLETDCADNGPFVLSFGKKAGRLTRNTRLLAKLRVAPSLGVVSRRGPFRLKRLLAQCTDFVAWPCGDDELELRLRHLFQPAASRAVADDQAAAADVAGLNLMGRSPRFQQFLTQLRKVAQCDVPVLIRGETGTGKELAARALHYLGERRNFPFIPVNCGAIPDELVENELFGHEKGAYTDARDPQTGAATQADKGTLFLDEIESLSPKAQAALLRFLQDQMVKPLGSQRLRQVDARVIAASSGDLHRLAEEGRFRQDLLFRLDVADLAPPPLRERAGDIALLAEHYLEAYAERLGQPEKRIHPATLAWMERYPWPGNIRELENVIQKGLLASRDDWVRVELLDAPYGDADSLPTPEGQNLALDMDFKQAKRLVVDQFEEQYLRHILAECGGNVSLASSKSHKERSAFGRLLKKHGINREQYT